MSCRLQARVLRFLPRSAPEPIKIPYPRGNRGGDFDSNLFTRPTRSGFADLVYENPRRNQHHTMRMAGPPASVCGEETTQLIRKPKQHSTRAGSVSKCLSKSKPQTSGKGRSAASNARIPVVRANLPFGCGRCAESAQIARSTPSAQSFCSAMQIPNSGNGYY